MGWRYRKSINLGGGFRINLSKSGIGYSWGFPGYRHTYNANGSQRRTYSIPGTGISYVESSGKGRQHYGNNQNSNLNYDQNTKLITGETEYYQNINVSQMGKDDEILRQISKLRTIDIVANVFLISIYLIPIGIVLKLLIAYKWKIDLNYEMDEINKKTYEQLNSFLLEIAKNNKIWQVGSSTRVYNTKYNAGAGSNITRHTVNIIKKMPWYISHNIDVYCLNLKREKIYFTPDRMLIFTKFGGVGSKKYSDMSAHFSFTNFVETEFVPRDAEIVRYTWRYVNKSGGPDRRFNDNRQIPVCKYGEINLETPDGINIMLECSNHRLIQGIHDKYTEFITSHHKTNDTILDFNVEREPQFKEQIKEPEPSSNTEDKWNIYNAEFEPEKSERLCETKEDQFIVEPVNEANPKENINPSEENNSPNNSNKIRNKIRKINKIICTMLCYVWISMSSIITLACIADKMYLAMILWLAVTIIFIPKAKENFIKKYPNYSKYIIPARIILIIISFFVLALTIPNVFEGTWISENNSIIIIEEDSFELRTNSKTYNGSYEYNRLGTTNSDIIHYEIIVDYSTKDNKINNIFHYYSNESERYICIYIDNQCTEYFKIKEN